MAEPLKNIYTKSFFTPLVQVWKAQDSSFEQNDFLNAVFNHEWDKMELKARYHHIAVCMANFLPEDYHSAIKFIVSQLEALKTEGINVGSYEYLFYPDFIETYGQEHFDASLEAMEQITAYISCEFAIRPFLKKHQKKVMSWLLQLSKHSHPNVRRFSSEGCRPKLPWGGINYSLVEDPSPILPILENLKSDDSLFVRKSVANNLNDISKDHPDLVLKIARQWKNYSTHTNWIIKHGCRTLLKDGHPEAMLLFDYAASQHFELSGFQINTPKVILGKELHFSYHIQNTSKQNCKLRLEYGIYFLKANGKLNRKVFKISEKELGPNESFEVNRKHVLKPMTTRTYYEGQHKLSVIINGNEIEESDFHLLFSPSTS